MGLPARLLSFRRVADRVPMVRGFGAGCPLIVRAGPHWPHGASARASTACGTGGNRRANGGASAGHRRYGQHGPRRQVVGCAEVVQDMDRVAA